MQQDFTNLTALGAYKKSCRGESKQDICSHELHYPK